MSNRKNVLVVDGENVIVTKAFQKKACIYGTKEYRLWKEVRSDMPNATMVIRTLKRNADKKTYKNLTYPNIEKFLKLQENSKELLEEYELERKKSVIQASPYHYIRTWFISKFPNYYEYEEKVSDKANDKNNKEASDTINKSNVTNIKKAANE